MAGTTQEVVHFHSAAAGATQGATRKEREWQVGTAVWCMPEPCDAAGGLQAALALRFFYTEINRTPTDTQVHRTLQNSRCKGRLRPPRATLGTSLLRQAQAAAGAAPFFLSFPPFFLPTGSASFRPRHGCPGTARWRGSAPQRRAAPPSQACRHSPAAWPPAGNGGAGNGGGGWVGGRSGEQAAAQT